MTILAAPGTWPGGTVASADSTPFAAVRAPGLSPGAICILRPVSPHRKLRLHAGSPSQSKVLKSATSLFIEVPVLSPGRLAADRS